MRRASSAASSSLRASVWMRACTSTLSESHPLMATAPFLPGSTVTAPPVALREETRTSQCLTRQPSSRSRQSASQRASAALWAASPGAPRATLRAASTTGRWRGIGSSGLEGAGATFPPALDTRGSVTVASRPVSLAAVPRAALTRTLRLRDLAFIVVGTVIGSGIFVVPGAVLRDTGGDVGYALLVWALGGGLSLLGALTYGELGGMLPEAGGAYVYVREAFGRLPAFLLGWTLFFVISTGSVATLAVAFAEYLRQFLPLGPMAGKVVAGLMIAVVAAVNVRGTRHSANVQNWRSEEHTSELQSHSDLVCRLLLEKKK